VTALACIALGLALLALLLHLRAPRRSELEYTAAFWRRAALRAAWREDDAAEAFAERQYLACEARLRGMATTKGPTE